MKRPSKGFSLIEAAIVLGIIGLVIGGIWVASTTVHENRRIAKTIEDISLIYNKAQKIMKDMPYGVSYSAADTDVMSLILPPGYSVTANQGVIGGDFGAIEMAIDGPPNNVLLIRFSSLSVATCARLGPRLGKIFEKQLNEPPSGGGSGGSLATPAEARNTCQEDWDDVGGSYISLYFGLN